MCDYIDTLATNVATCVAMMNQKDTHGWPPEH